jgi:hypothetical protein
MIEAIKAQRRALQPEVFAEILGVENGKYCDELSLNAFVGSKAEEYLDLKDDVISSPLEYSSKWLKGLKKAHLKSKALGIDPRHMRMYDLLTGSYPHFKKYLNLFLEGSFLKHYEEFYKKKPKVAESEYWFGNNEDTYGFLVTPRFVNGGWENDKSEIRHFEHPYWTLSHVLETGLCIMGEEKMQAFTELSDYLQFFRALAKRTRSQYQLDIADRYVAYVNSHSNPNSVPVLIPELRYDPLKHEHEHRLDFLIINPWTLEKVGFEFSPWSTHGKLKGAGRPMAAYNREAKENFELEMAKHKKYWRKYGVNYITYTDIDLLNMDTIWEEIRGHLEPAEVPQQLELSMLSDLK